MGANWPFDMVDYPKESLRTDYKDYFRVYVAPGVLTALGLEKGDPCDLIVSGKTVGTVLVWENKNSKEKQLQISKRLQSFYGVDRREKASLSKKNDLIPGAMQITLHEVTSNGMKAALPKLPDEHFPLWEHLLERHLHKVETISPRMVIENIVMDTEQRSFDIIRVNKSSAITPYRFERSCEIEIINEQALRRAGESDLHDRGLEIPTDGIGGLEIQLRELNKEIAEFGIVEEEVPTPYLPKWRNGIILYGSSGTGKSLLLRRIGEAGWRGVFDLGAELSKYPAAGDKRLASLRILFANARKRQPSIILLDKVEKFAADQSTHSPLQSNYIDALREEMERLSSCRTMVVATTNSLAKVNAELRDVDGFSLEMEIPVPNSKSRASILGVLRNVPPGGADKILENVASRTHGFVGADLRMLLYVAMQAAKDRINVAGMSTNIAFTMDQIEETDFLFALRKVKPTAIREVFVEIQETRWDDIGGQEEAKKILHRALIWPSKYPDLLKASHIKPGKGLLLYGPPGCSKTMIARAAATESNYNFIAVKGAELLDMYVGESERKIRDIFSLARAASPSILFFDEIDALGTSRGDGQHSGLNVVTTLLNEMDGIIARKDVFVLGATNRPDFIDSALTRPGRLNKMLYVGPPTLDARRSILRKEMQLMAVETNLDVEALAKETDGFSGAELVEICESARLASFEDFVSEFPEGGTTNTPLVCRSHFNGAIAGTAKAINAEMLEFFEDFRIKHSS